MDRVTYLAEERDEPAKRDKDKKKKRPGWFLSSCSAFLVDRREERVRFWRRSRNLDESVYSINNQEDEDAAAASGEGGERRINTSSITSTPSCGFSSKISMATFAVFRMGLPRTLKLVLMRTPQPVLFLTATRSEWSHGSSFLDTT